MGYNYKFLLRKDYTKVDNLKPIYLRVFVDQKKKDYSLRISIPEELWDETNSKVKKSLKFKSEELNYIITSAKVKIEKIILEAKLSDKKYTLAEIDKLFVQDNVDQSSFYNYAEKFIKDRKEKFSSDTIRTYNSQITKMKQFKAQLTFDEIDADFLKKYESFMISKWKNTTNTLYKSLGFIKTVWFEAMKEGLVTDNIFKYFPLKKKEGTRNFLSMDELKVLEALLESDDLKNYHKNALSYFLFSCYTGLRYTDIKNLKYKHLANTNFVQIEMHKTKDVVRIPLIEKAKALIKTGFENQEVFRVASNQKANQYLKEVISHAKINKEISFHCARHTFATCCIDLGIPIEVISKLLGHHDLRTTQIYAKVGDTVKVEYMGKWDS